MFYIFRLASVYYVYDESRRRPYLGKKRNHINIRLGFQNITKKHQIVKEEELCQNNTYVVKKKYYIFTVP